jgi:ABC-2 type transport system permease protein
MLLCFSLRFILEGVFRNNQVEQTLQKVAKITDDAANVYLPARWISDAVTKRSLPDILINTLLLAGISLALFVIVFRIVGNSYRNINSALK